MVEWSALDDAWPKGRTTMEPYEIGDRHRECLARIHEIQESIIGIEARTLSGAAVHLRRVEAMLDRENPAAMRLLASARQKVEAHLEAA